MPAFIWPSQSSSARRFRSSILLSWLSLAFGLPTIPSRHADRTPSELAWSRRKCYASLGRSYKLGVLPSNRTTNKHFVCGLSILVLGWVEKCVIEFHNGTRRATD